MKISIIKKNERNLRMTFILVSKPILCQLGIKTNMFTFNCVKTAGFIIIERGLVYLGQCNMSDLSQYSFGKPCKLKSCKTQSHFLLGIVVIPKRKEEKLFTRCTFQVLIEPINIIPQRKYFCIASYIL